MIAKDAAWLRGKNNYNCINVDEFDTVLKGINPALKWGLREMEVRTDSATVLSWVNSAVEESGRICMKGVLEMIVRQRLKILEEVIFKFGL